MNEMPWVRDKTHTPDSDRSSLSPHYQNPAMVSIVDDYVVDECTWMMPMGNVERMGEI